MAKAVLIAILAMCFPGFWLLAIRLLARPGPGEGPAWWIVNGAYSWAVVVAPLLAIAAMWVFGRLRLVRFRNKWTWGVMAGVVIAGGAVHTLLWLAILFSPARLLDTRVSPNGHWTGRVMMTAWLDRSYWLTVEEGWLPVKCREARESMQVQVRFGRAEVRWSPDSRYVTAWMEGIPLCAYDTSARKEVSLEQNLLLFVPATAQERSDLLDRLIAHGASPVRWLGSAVPAGQEALRLEVLGKIADVNAPATRGFQDLPLHAAVRSGDDELVLAVLERGADCNAFLPGVRPSMTALMMAASRGDVNVVRILVEHGADAARVDENGKKAADFARGERREEVLRVLEGARGGRHTPETQAGLNVAH